MLHARRRKPSLVGPVSYFSGRLVGPKTSHRAKHALGMKNADRPEGGNTSCSMRRLRGRRKPSLLLYSQLFWAPALSNLIVVSQDNCAGKNDKYRHTRPHGDTRRRHTRDRSHLRNVVNRCLLDLYY